MIKKKREKSAWSITITVFQSGYIFVYLWRRRKNKKRKKTEIASEQFIFGWLSAIQRLSLVTKSAAGRLGNDAAGFSLKRNQRYTHTHTDTYIFIY